MMGNGEFSLSRYLDSSLHWSHNAALKYSLSEAASLSIFVSPSCLSSSSSLHAAKVVAMTRIFASGAS